MENRTTAWVITIIAVLFCGCPGLAFLLFGVTGFLDYYAFNSYIYGINDPVATNIWGSFGICGGLIFIAITVLVSVLVLRRKKVAPPRTNEPVPPAI